ncbi:hypothetical protein N9B88_03545 [Rubripirellula sp.]|nr:hypothetical protein [Rubripirellula sp.]
MGSRTGDSGGKTDATPVHSARGKSKKIRNLSILCLRVLGSLAVVFALQLKRLPSLRESPSETVLGQTSALDARDQRQ